MSFIGRLVWLLAAIVVTAAVATATVFVWFLAHTRVLGYAEGFLVLGLVSLFFPSAAAITLLILTPLAAYGGRRGFADISFMVSCGAILAGLPGLAFALLSGDPVSPTIGADAVSISVVLDVTAMMAVSGGMAGAVYWVILRPNAYFRAR